ncbi:fungal-specific actin related protein [Flagelloscypha sp. PMI_526]|nr:fungal-specific actin related protein [Flagelloscypha sp. PMI_526]
MSDVPPATPRRASAVPGATTSRIASTSHASPHYTTTRRHSLYGVEDRIVIDPGSRIWKVGFSGEGRPRDVLYATGAAGPPLWSLSRASDPVEREEEDRILAIRIESIMRNVFHNCLLTDPKARKVIIVEHPLMPMHVKDVLARTLFENLQVPSVSFATSHLLSLCAIGRITGLVLDAGHLEAVALPHKTTPVAGQRLSTHIKALLMMFGTYYPPPTSLMAAANIPRDSRAARVPEEVLTDAVMEQIKTRLTCNLRQATSLPSESNLSQSDFSSSQNFSSSEFSAVIVSHPQLSSSTSETAKSQNKLQSLESLYKRHSTARDIQMRVNPPAAQQAGTGLGTLLIPGWIRERATEMLFEAGDVDESSLPEVVLDALLKVPVDLRRTMAASILVAGGTSMLPGFASRLHSELVRRLSHVPPPSPSRRGRTPIPAFDRYAALRPLLKHFAVLNHPSPLPTSTSERAQANSGKAPAFTPATLAWVGGSLAGSLKTGGLEVSREKWDEANARESDDLDEDLMIIDPRPTSVEAILPDWTKMSPVFTAA